jgi:uncharacterized membrane protein YkvA (DUF1232 family)
MKYKKENTKKKNKKDINEDDIKSKSLFEFINHQFKDWELKAKEYLNNREKTEQLIEDAKEKAENDRKGPIAEVWDKIMLFIDIIKSFLNGEYKEIPIGSILMIMIGLVYFVIPTDIIPDWLAVLGQIDDATVLGFIVKQISSDLDKYSLWKSKVNVQDNSIDIG